MNQKRRERNSGGHTQSSPRPSQPGEEDEDSPARCSGGRGAEGLAGRLAPLSRCFEIGASRGKMLRAVGDVGPPPWIPISRTAQGPPGTRLSHGRGTPAVTEGENPRPSPASPLPVAASSPRSCPCQWLSQSRYPPNTLVLMSAVKDGLWEQWVMLGAGAMAVSFLSRLETPPGSRGLGISPACRDKQGRSLKTLCPDGRFPVEATNVSHHRVNTPGVQ